MCSKNKWDEFYQKGPSHSTRGSLWLRSGRRRCIMKHYIAIATAHVTTIHAAMKVEQDPDAAMNFKF